MIKLIYSTFCILIMLSAVNAGYEFTNSTDVQSIEVGTHCLSTDGGATYREVYGIHIRTQKVFDLFLPIEGTPEQDYIYAAILQNFNKENVTKIYGLHHQSAIYGRVTINCYQQLRDVKLVTSVWNDKP